MSRCGDPPHRAPHAKPKVLVAGSAIFGSGDYQRTIEAVRRAIG
jgi:pentose-5-phosphate-3-epimerase